jgi:hypothetical protein
MDLVTRVLLSGQAIVGTPRRRLYRYRRHEQNATAQLTRELTRFREEAAFYDGIAERSRALGLKRSAKIAAAKRIIRMNLLYCLLRDAARLRFADARAKTKLLSSLA